MKIEQIIYDTTRGVLNIEDKLSNFTINFELSISAMSNTYDSNSRTIS